MIKSITLRTPHFFLTCPVSLCVIICPQSYFSNHILKLLALAQTCIFLQKIWSKVRDRSLITTRGEGVGKLAMRIRRIFRFPPMQIVRKLLFPPRQMTKLGLYLCLYFHFNMFKEMKNLLKKYELSMVKKKNQFPPPINMLKNIGSPPHPNTPKISIPTSSNLRPPKAIIN